MKISDKTKNAVDDLRFRQQVLGLQIQLSVMADLVDKLDPDHNYQYDQRTSEFIKTPKKEK